MPTALVGRRTVPAHRRSRVPRRGRSAGLVVCRFLVAVFVPVLAFGWLRGEKTVTLQLDGRPQRVQTHARTVGELLDRAGVEVDHQDLLVPGRSSALADGMAVEFVGAREVTVVQGDTEQRLVVPALSADDVVTALKARGGDQAAATLVSPAPLAPVHDGMILEVSLPVSVTVVADGRTREATMPEGTTTAELLERLDLALREDDRIEPAADVPLGDGAKVVISRVTRTVEARQVAVPPEVVVRKTADLPAGKRRVVRPGREGRLNVVETITLVDGVEESRARDQQEVIVAPLTRIVEIGTARPPDGRQGPPAPRLPPSPLAPTRLQLGGASWYDFGNGLTAAHRTLPKGTMVTVTNLANGKAIRVRINDRGPFIEGRIIDLNRPAFAALATPSEGVIDVRITW